MAKEKPGVMLYWEVFDTLDRLKPEKAKLLLRSIRNFSQHGEAPDFHGDESLEIVWPLIQQKIAADSERYEAIRAIRAEAGRRGGEAKARNLKQNEANASFAKQIKPTSTTSPTVTIPTTITRTSTTEGIPTELFAPPSIEEVQEYCTERNSFVDPQQFFDHYAANGWMMGSTQMRDWKAAVRKWEKNAYSKKDKAGSPIDYGDPEDFYK